MRVRASLIDRDKRPVFVAWASVNKSRLRVSGMLRGSGGIKGSCGSSRSGPGDDGLAAELGVPAGVSTEEKRGILEGVKGEVGRDWGGD